MPGRRAVPGVNRSEGRWEVGEGLGLFARRWEPEGEPVGAVGLVHGLGEHSGRYDHVATHLAGAGYAVCAFDLRGHGQSDGRRGDTRFGPAMDDIDRLLAETAGRFPDRPLFLYGHSLGGLLVLTYGVRRRPALAGVVATGAALSTSLREQKVKLLAVRVLGGIVPGLSMPSGLDANLVSRDPAVVAAYQADPLTHARVTLGLARDAVEAADSTMAAAARFPVPLLLLHGGADRLTYPGGSEAFAASARGDCTVIIYNGLYHEVHNEPEQGRVLADISGWLDDHR